MSRSSAGLDAFLGDQGYYPFDEGSKGEVPALYKTAIHSTSDSDRNSFATEADAIPTSQVNVLCGLQGYPLPQRTYSDPYDRFPRCPVDYTPPIVCLDRVLGSALCQHEHQEWIYPPPMACGGNHWSTYGTTSCLHTMMQDGLSRQLHVYPGRPVEQIEKEYEGLSHLVKKRTNRKRENLPKESTAVLKQWLLSHLLMPYPVNEEKIALCSATGLDIAQINNWFINARVRIWKPLVTSIYKKYRTQLQTQAWENGDEGLVKRIDEADRSTTMGMITLLSSIPEARAALDQAATDSASIVQSR